MADHNLNAIKEKTILSSYAPSEITSALTHQHLPVVSALTQDGYLIDEPAPHARAPASGLLLMGWIGIAYGQFAWLGNPLLIMSWIQFSSGKFTRGLKFACAALIFMLSFLLYPTVVSSEAPDYSKITSYELGYWLWVISAATAIAAQYLAIRRRRETREGKDQIKAEIL